MSSRSEYEYEGAELLRLGEQLKNYNDVVVGLFLKYLPPSARVLDFGAGRGTLAALVTARGVKPDCVEPDAGQRALLEAQGFRCYSSITDVPSNSYTFIYSSNVLEHIEDDVVALGELHRVLNEQGTLAVYLPAFQILFTVVDSAIGHYRRYDRLMITRRAEQAGFRVKEAYYVDILGFFISLIFKWTSNRVGTVNPRTMMIYDRFIFPLSRWIEQFVRPPFGKNVFAVATKVAKS